MPGAGAGSEWERLFWLLFERTTNPVALVSEQRVIIEMNAPSLELFGRSRGEMIGAAITDFIKPEEQSEAAAQWEEFRRTGDFEGRRTFVRPDGSEIVLALAARMAQVGSRRLAVYVVVPQQRSWAVDLRKQPAEPSLTRREREVVTLIALGRETNDIAAELHISAETVRTHVRNAMGKLDVHTRAELVAVVMCNEDVIDIIRLE